MKIVQEHWRFFLKSMKYIIYHLGVSMISKIDHSITIDKIINRTEKVSLDNKRKKILSDYFQKKSGEDIANYLFETRASELGGITALSGFYYQLLVTIEYVIEMLEGKWDFVIMEYHDDIVVGKENKVRYIQVKTSEKINVKVTQSPANGLYTRKTKTINKKRYKQPNSWVDKLFKNSLITKKSDNFDTEFVLYSSYHFIGSSLDVDLYTGNKEFNEDLEIDKKGKIKNKLYKKLTNEKVYDDDGQEIEIESYYEEKLEELLKRFFIKTGPSLQDIKSFKLILCSKLNNILFQDFHDKTQKKVENITVAPSDLDHIIGYLFEKCTDKTALEKLVIRPEDLTELISDLREQTFQKANEISKIHSSIEAFEDAINLITDGFIDTKNENDIKNIFFEYNDYLNLWVKDEGGNVTDLVNRLFIGSKKGGFYKSLETGIRDTSIRDLFTSSVALSLISESNMKFDNSDFFLTKQSELEELTYSFFRMEPRKNSKKILQRIESIMRSKKPLELLVLSDRTIKIVIYNCSDLNFSKVIKNEFLFNIDIEIEGSIPIQKLNDTPFKIAMYPGQRLNDVLIHSLDEDDMHIFLTDNMKEIEEEIQ